MKTATITEAKNGLSALIDQVRAGDSVLLTDRGIPVAVIEPVTSELDATGRIARLARAGTVRPGASGAVPRALIDAPPPGLLREVDAIQLLVEDRGDRV